MFLLATLFLVLGVIFLGRYFYLKKQAEENKNFVVLGSTLILCWMFPGAALMIIGLVILFVLL